MSPASVKSSNGKGLQESARQKRSVDDADDEMEASCCAAEADTHHGDGDITEDSTTKRPKTGDGTGMGHCYPLTVNYRINECVSK